MTATLHSPATSKAPVLRDALGRYPAGVSGNPNGSSKYGIVRAYAMELTNGGRDAIMKLVSLMHDPHAPYNVQLRAAELIIERIDGRARQRIDVNPSADDPDVRARMSAVATEVLEAFITENLHRAAAEAETVEYRATS